MADGYIEFGAGGPDRLEAEDFVWPESVGVRHPPAKCPPWFGQRRCGRGGLDALSVAQSSALGEEFMDAAAFADPSDDPACPASGRREPPRRTAWQLRGWRGVG